MLCDYPQVFERDVGCTPDEWRGRLPAAIGDYAWQYDDAGDGAQVRIGAGTLTLRWWPLPPRVMAQMCLPRLRVRFAFIAVDDLSRRRFMRRFDLYMQRGGG